MRWGGVPTDRDPSLWKIRAQLRLASHALTQIAKRFYAFGEEIRILNQTLYQPFWIFPRAVNTVRNYNGIARGLGCELRPTFFPSARIVPASAPNLIVGALPLAYQGYST